VGFAKELAVGLKDNGAISSVNVLGNGLGKEGAEVLGSAWNHHSTLKTICGELDQLDFSGELGDGLPVVLVELKYNGALSSANLLWNHIGIDQAKALATILKGHSALKSLCGNRGDETELDISGWDIGALVWGVISGLPRRSSVMTAPLHWVCTSIASTSEAVLV
jgi:hypothetical protein